MISSEASLTKMEPFGLFKPMGHAPARELSRARRALKRLLITQAAEQNIAQKSASASHAGGVENSSTRQPTGKYTALKSARVAHRRARPAGRRSFVPRSQQAFFVRLCAVMNSSAPWARFVMAQAGIGSLRSPWGPWALESLATGGLTGCGNTVTSCSKNSGAPSRNTKTSTISTARGATIALKTLNCGNARSQPVSDRLIITAPDAGATCTTCDAHPASCSFR